MSVQPVFIIGAARSGTKFLRDCFQQHSECVVIPFDVNYVWRIGNQNSLHDALNPELARPEVVNRIQKTFNGYVQKKSPKACFFIEKTVSNCLRVPFIEKIYDNARYVHLIRDGREVVASSMRQWSMPSDWRYLVKKQRELPCWDLSYLVKVISSRFTSQSIWGVRYPDILEDLASLSLPEICAKQWFACVTQAQQDLQIIPNTRVLEVRYENLVADQSVIESVAKFVGIKDIPSIVNRYNQSLMPNQTTQWLLLDDMNRARIETHILRTLKKLGYGQAARTLCKSFNR